MTHDIHALSGAYAVDAVDEHERLAFEEHLSLCPACQAEVASLRETAAVMASAQEAAPSAELRDRVLLGIKSVRPIPPENAVASANSSASVAHASSQPGEPMAEVHSLGARRARRSRPAARWLVAAAAVIAVGAGSTAIVQSWGNGEPGQVAAQASLGERIQAAPDAEHTKLALDGGSATVWRSKSLGRAVIVTKDMPDAPSGHTYQLWLQNDAGKLTGAGLMAGGPTQSVVFEGDAAKAAGAGITIEPSGGSENPTTDPIALFAFQA